MANHAFQLRKATINDFSDYYPLQLDSLYHWLLFDRKEELVQEEVVTESPNYFFSDEDIKHITDYFENFNQSQFSRDLEVYRIYMITIGHKTAGYVKLEKYNGKLIIREWPMFFEYRSPELLEAILAEIEKLKMPKCKAIQAIALANSSVSFLTQQGYSLKIKPFLEKAFI